MTAQGIVLYHRTDRRSAEMIVATRRWRSRENTGEVFLSTTANGQAAGYGDAIVSVRVPADLCRLDDEFPDGEQHYAVLATRLDGRAVVAWIDK